jgi:hypothetical protein
MSEVIVEHKPHTPLTGRALKCTVALSPAEILAQPVPEGRPRIVLRIRVPDRTVTADIATKSLRRAQATIRENGVEGCAVVLQGKLNADNTLAEAGLTVQAKTKAEAPTKQNGVVGERE